MSKHPYTTLDVRRLEVDELKYPLTLCRHNHWPITALQLEEVSSSAIFLGAFPPSKDQHHLYERQDNLTAPNLLGTIAVYPQGSNWSIGYVLVDPAHHHNGIATMLMKKAIQSCQESGKAKSMLLSATDQGSPVYKRLGFVAREERMYVLSAPIAKISESLMNKDGADMRNDEEVQLEPFDPKKDAERWSRGIELAGLSSHRNLEKTVAPWTLDSSPDLYAVLVTNTAKTKLEGFGVLRPMGTLKWHIGPLVASSPAIARTIVRHFSDLTIKSSLAGSEEHLAISAICYKPSQDVEWTDWLKGLGMEISMDVEVMSYNVSDPGQQSLENGTTTTDVRQWAYVDPGAM